MDTGFGARQLYSACKVTATHHYPVDGTEIKDPSKATGFLVEFPTGDSRIGLVTNRHVVDLTFYDNPEDIGTVVKLIKVHWWQSNILRLEHTIANPKPLYHPDPLIDVAVIPITSTPETRIDVVGEMYGDLGKFMAENSDENIAFEHAICWEDLENCEELWPQLEPGEFVAFPGYPVWHDHSQLRPVMRPGMISSDPQTDYRSDEGAPTKRDSSHQLLFDAYSTEGNSGSPVYVAQRGLPPINIVSQMSDGSLADQGTMMSPKYHRSFLIGINASHYNDTGILHHNEHAGLSRMHKLSVIMDILRANTAPHGTDARRLNLLIPTGKDAPEEEKAQA